MAVQADARIAWLDKPGGSLSVVADDGVSGRVVVASQVTGFELAGRGDAVVYTDSGAARTSWLLVFGRAPVRLPEGTHMDVGGDGGVAWSPDGRELAIARVTPGVGAQLLIVDRAGRTRKAWAMGKSRQPEGVAWRPDGKRLAFVRTGVTQTRPSQIVLLPRTAGGGPRVMRTAGRDHPLARFPAWTRDGVALMVGAESWSSQDTSDDMTLALVSGPGQPRILGVDEGAPRSVSPDGRRFALNGSCVYDLRRDGCTVGSALPGMEIQDLSPDGGRALVVYDGRLQVQRLEPGAMPYALAVEGSVLAAQWRAG
ncbi:TolB family protein [Baekduia sp. Peel2402]|uniref:TolB family protein n=1 Tax=Baekduia sp. Peel2402 TaxID=3458296 RepID=UPI00403E3BE5